MGFDAFETLGIKVLRDGVESYADGDGEEGEGGMDGVEV